MDLTFLHLNKPYSVKIDRIGDNHKVVINEVEYEVSDCVQQQNIVSFGIKDKCYTVYFAEDKDKIFLTLNGNYFVFESAKSGAKSSSIVSQTGDSVSSPMPGLIVKIPVKVGDKVKEGTTLAIVEAMKMQNELRAPRDGVVDKVNFKEGAQVDALKPIVELESE